jgi:hypothetical protein
MCFSQFFGEKSIFDVIIAAAALLTGFYTLYKNFMERAKLSAFPGDRLGLVISVGGGCQKMHLRANLVNHAVKTGTLHRLEAEVTDPQDRKHRYYWRLFFEYLPGAQAVQPKSAPHPLSLPGKTSQLLMAEFETSIVPQTPSWLPGRYSVELIGWVNRENRKQCPNLRQTFHFDLTQALSDQITQLKPTQQAQVLEVPISEWAA